MAKALPRSSGSVKVVVNNANTAGANKAPNMPWMVRAATNMVKFWATAPKAEAVAKPASPMMSAFLRPM
jgi:hypothetical protein